jgi:site-specific recombinase XerD
MKKSASGSATKSKAGPTAKKRAQQSATLAKGINHRKSSQKTTDEPVISKKNALRISQPGKIEAQKSSIGQFSAQADLAIGIIPASQTVAPLVPVTSLHPADSNPALIYLARLQPSGRRTMASRLKLIAKLLGHEDITKIQWSQLRYPHVEAIRTKLSELSLSPASINAALCALRGVARVAWRLEQMTAEEYERIRSVNAVAGSRLPAGRALERSEVAALLDACAQDDSPAGARDAAIIALIFGGGLRRSEAASLKVEDFKADNHSLRVLGKGNKERLVYLATGATQAVQDWLRLRGSQEGALLCPVRKNGNIALRAMTAQAIYNALHKRSTAARLTSCSPHDGRRTFISELLEAGADLSAVQQLAGHANIQTTARYDRRGEKTKQKAAALLHLPYRKRND